MKNFLVYEEHACSMNAWFERHCVVWSSFMESWMGPQHIKDVLHWKRFKMNRSNSVDILPSSYKNQSPVKSIQDNSTQNYNFELSWNSISIQNFHFELNWHSNAANSSWNFILNQMICRESVLSRDVINRYKIDFTIEGCYQVEKQFLMGIPMWCLPELRHKLIVI